MKEIIEYPIYVGSLSNLDSLYHYVSPRLVILRKLFRASQYHVEVVWNLTGLRPKLTNMFALTTFLSIADKIAELFARPARLILPTNSDVITFLHNINFLKLSQELNILYWDQSYAGLIDEDKYNPYSELLYYYKDTEDWKLFNKHELAFNKEFTRDEIKSKISSNLSGLFKYKVYKSIIDPQTKSTLLKIASELALNSILHGKSKAFLGLQRTSKLVTINVCDSGIGFKRSMKKNLTDIKDISKITDLSSLVLASVLREDDLGLKRAINSTVDVSEGRAILSSNMIELCWGKNNWRKIKDEFIFSGVAVKNYTQFIGKKKTDYPNENDFVTGYYRRYKNPIAGARISFEVPIKNNNTYEF